MKITEVRMEKLFSLARYNNERIGFTANVGPMDNPDQVAAKLHLKIMCLEKCLDINRRLISLVHNRTQQFRSYNERIETETKQINDTKVTMEELIKAADKGDVDSRLKHACSRTSLKSMKEELEKMKEGRLRVKTALEVASKALNILTKRIKSGTFDLTDLELPEDISAYDPYFPEQSY